MLLIVSRKDVRLPQSMQRSMAAEAEAGREARAKVIAAEGEQKASRQLKEAADVIAESPIALQLRYLQTLTQISAEHNSTIIFPIPSNFSEYPRRSCPSRSFSSFQLNYSISSSRLVNPPPAKSLNSAVKQTESDWAKGILPCLPCKSIFTIENLFLSHFLSILSFSSRTERKKEINHRSVCVSCQCHHFMSITVDRCACSLVIVSDWLCSDA